MTVRADSIVFSFYLEDESYMMSSYMNDESLIHFSLNTLIAVVIDYFFHVHFQLFTLPYLT